MKVLLISNMYPSQKYPSYGVFVKNFVEGFEREGALIDKIVLYKEESTLLKIIKYILFYINIIIKGLCNDYDLVYVHYISHCAIPLIILDKFKNIKLFINVHGSDVIPEKQSQEKFQKYVKNIIKKAYKIIVPSEYFKKLVCEKYNIDISKFIISPSGGVNEEIFYKVNDRNSLREKYNYLNDDKIIGYVSRIDVGKGWDIFLKSCDQLINKKKKDIKVLIVGSGLQLEEFNKMLADLNLKDKVIHLNLLPQERLRDVYNIIDVFCFPTIRDGESLGLVALEAMACGTPVIGNDVGALSEYIENGSTGFLVNSISPVEFSDKVDYLLNDIQFRRDEYSNRCIKIASSYFKKKVIVTLYNEIKEIVNV
ncbi:TPA: glycosyltransferase family 4 protein [Clostridium perfringens]|nr:glycosyltransferase family 4 protein [Clostridium perfringens]